MTRLEETIIKEACSRQTLDTKVLERIKRDVASSSDNKRCFSNIKLLKTYRDLIEKKEIKENKKLFDLLKKQKTRSMSGIVSVAVLVKEFPCPGDCLFCPTEKGLPKSYFSDEPAVMRALLTDFNPYKQVKARLKALNLTGHDTDKIELIIIGGTFSSIPKSYRTNFVKRCFDAANNETSSNLTLAQKSNELAGSRIVGITVETRPDQIDEKEIKYLRKLGVTRVELGVQSINNNVLSLNRRGHSTGEIISATKLLKDYGFKINYHMMPNLPGSSYNEDKEMFGTLFSDENYQPDLLKIYPCVITRDSKLIDYYKKKKYVPYSDNKIVKLLAEIKKELPRYVRIMRLGRDIPAQDIIAGNKLSNIRQVVKKYMKEKNWKCHCIRCMEAKDKKICEDNLKMFIKKYHASNGIEYFISYEDKDRQNLFAVLRLRINSDGKSATIREVHTYGKVVKINKVSEIGDVQHQGLGKRLIMEAENIVLQKYNIKIISVISGVGVRDYYRKLGYRLRDTYMIKRLK